MRHILVHAYYSIDADAVWRVVEQHLPALVEQFEAVLPLWESPPKSDEEGRPEQA